MKVLTVFAHNDRRSFCGGVLDRFSAGLADAGHTNDVLDLYAISSIPSSGTVTSPATPAVTSPPTSSSSWISNNASVTLRYELTAPRNDDVGRQPHILIPPGDHPP